MKYKTLFRTLLKVIGVWLTAEGIIAFVAGIAQTISMFAQVRDNMGTVWWVIAVFSQGLIQIGLGLYLFFGGRWIADLAIPGNRQYCHECGYDLSHSTSNHQCPECGTAFRAGP